MGIVSNKNTAYTVIVHIPQRTLCECQLTATYRGYISLGTDLFRFVNY